jgi:hypothetical protein
MDLCSLEDAFPDIKKGSIQGSGVGSSPGCTDTKPSREERRAARKRAKQCKTGSGAAAPPTTDPDRPAFKRMGEIPAFTSYEEAYKDVSGLVLPKTSLVAPPKVEEEETKEEFRLPTLPGANCLFSDQGLPSYFGKGLDDVEEGFQSYSSMQGDDPGYMLIPRTMDASFEGKGVTKAGSTNEGVSKLPAPFLEDAWKPITPAGSRTAYFPAGADVASAPLPQNPKVAKIETSPSRPGLDAMYSRLQKGPAAGDDDSSREVLLKRIQELTKRLDDLEQKNPRNQQAEVLFFVGTGLIVLATFDIAMRLR